MSKNLTNIGHIGSTELIGLPDQGIFDVPAKVDTGADSSAIWASEIHEQDGMLSFVLFGKSSPFYTGEVLKTRDFRISSIKNSFGQSEFRYKVRLKAVIAGRTVQVRFTLANRANNRYPVLIGRRTIKGKFLVDVSRKYATGKRQVLLITIKKTDNLQDFIARLQTSRPRINYTIATYDELTFYVGGESNRVTVGSEGQDIANFDMVHFKVVPRRYLDIAASAAQYLKNRGIPFIDRAVADFSGTSKLHQYMCLSEHGIPVPASVFVDPRVLQASFHVFQQKLGLPFILKDIYGSKGRNNFLIADEAGFNAVAQTVAQENIWLAGQEYINNNGDYRLLVLGKRVELIIYRQKGRSDTHLNNTSMGGHASLKRQAELPSHVIMNAVNAAVLFERDIAGVDMVQDKTSGSWYCLEVNEDPQIATGAFLAEKQTAVAGYLERKLMD